MFFVPSDQVDELKKPVAVSSLAHSTKLIIVLDLQLYLIFVHFLLVIEANWDAT